MFQPMGWLMARVKALCRRPVKGSEWRLKSEPPWTLNVFKVVRVEGGWVEYVAQDDYGNKGLNTSPVSTFYTYFAPYRPSPETLGDRMAHRLNPTPLQKAMLFPSLTLRAGAEVARPVVGDGYTGNGYTSVPNGYTSVPNGYTNGVSTH